MERIVEEKESTVFRQDDGQITAWFSDSEEKMVLTHKGDPTYKKIFYILVLFGFLYLTFIFFSH